MTAIRVNGLGKAYRKYENRWSRVREWVFPWAPAAYSQNWVLRDVSFAVGRGEAVAIVGMNGAGKSTLLKLIAGTVVPTSGTVECAGSIAALLELGIGFHPDFTGRQNVIMAGQLLGMSTEEILERMAWIEAFAEIGPYIDQPVRTYSSGMQVRLAFSVATARRPDVLIIDEALSVGDAYFQHKSFARIRELREQSTTLLIVSHDGSSIRSLCDRVVLLDAGRLELEGSPAEVMDFYNAKLAQRQIQTVQRRRLDDGELQTVSGTGEATVENIELLDGQSRPVAYVGVGAEAVLRVDVRIHAPIPRLVLGYIIKDRIGQDIYGTNTHFKELPQEQLQVGERIRYDIRFRMNLGPGSYTVSTALVSTDTHLVNNYQWKDRALVFGVRNLDKTSFIGSAWLDPQISVLRDSRPVDAA